MTVVSSREFITEQDRYFDMAMTEQVFVQRGENMFVFARTDEYKEPDMIFEPDEDFYRSISMEELRKRVLNDVHQWYKERNESNSSTGSTVLS